MPNLSRRHLVTTAAALPALAVPAVADQPAHDPIFAAIERHRRACAETTAAFGRLTALEHELSKDRALSAGDLDAEPQHQAADFEAGSAADRQDDVAIEMLHTQPTTVAGATAVLSYYVEAEAPGEQVFPEFLDDNGNRADTSDDDGTKTHPAFGYLLTRNVARALAQMAVRS